ncbi:hypothetical protein [Thalassorhabdomicrobium marinisediminis]|uniref:Uncharacterized protein n=1 Tax=Thalassorhabdomicrobium marinisediminis TaxID=2170577 RepID=A0A2T7FVA0_9RHOB|nr:hypothetical protein [Thalassorhabdomicrobium marinisediminis]PVA06085.1 hypothetical protein DC363_12275 [Thalassorhabdomicrobium marinisediminis]
MSAAPLLAALLRIGGLGAVLAALSELWFYPVTLTGHSLALVLFYGPLAYTAWLAAARCGIATWAGGVWAACLFGFLIEGVPVTVLYEAVPFTIFWTSIGWHAVISVALGLWAFRWITATRSFGTGLLACAALGAYLGGFAVEMWSLGEGGGPWVWTPTGEVARQMLAGWVMFAGGHLLLDQAARYPVRPARGEFWVFATLTALAYGVGILVPVFPMSLLLPVLVALALWLMRRDGQGTRGAPMVARASAVRVPPAGYAASFAIPVAAIGTYHLLSMWDLRLESAAIHVLLVGPMALIVLAWATLRCLTGPKAP